MISDLDLRWAPCRTLCGARRHHLAQSGDGDHRSRAYDAIAGNRPTDWPSRFDLSRWGFFKASLDGVRVGGAAVARPAPDFDMMEGRADLAVLWDIRVAPSARGQGVGTALFEAAAIWASEQGCRELKIETQDVNRGACRFYARQGCVLRGVHHGAYPLFPDELQLLWCKTLVSDAPAPRG
jgi:GNAT superfamily N-acetyltransferase